VPRPENQMPCCDAWRMAQQRGTDNEMYGALLWIEGETALMGCDLPPVQFCPWCGAEKPPKAQPENAN